MGEIKRIDSCAQVNWFIGISREPPALVLKSLGPQPKKKEGIINKKKKKKRGLAKLLGAERHFEVVKNPL